MATTIAFHIAIGIFAMFMGRASSECCPTFWTPFGESCYRLVAKPETWETAEAICQELGSNIPDVEAHLVSIHTQEENDFAQKYYEGMYQSAVIMRGQRKEVRKPTSYNGFWLGLNNQGKTLDDFVWSDNTEMSSTYWQDTVYKKINKCGHTWTSPSKLKGQWNAARCSTKLPFMCKLLPIDVPDESNSDDYTSVSYSRSSLGPQDRLPCSWRGLIFLHGEALVLDECTICECDNSTVKCEIRSCQPTFCEEPISLERECCDVCPYDVPVYGVELIGVKSVKSGNVSDIHADLRIDLNVDGQGVDGENLWKVSMWGSSSADGQGKKIGFKEQVLTEGQASKRMVRPPISGGYEFTIADIEFSLDASGTSCEEVKYLCASFNMNDTPDTKDPRIPFNVYGVESEHNSNQNPARLVGCQTFTYC